MDTNFAPIILNEQVHNHNQPNFTQKQPLQLSVCVFSSAKYAVKNAKRFSEVRDINTTERQITCYQWSYSKFVQLQE